VYVSPRHPDYDRLKARASGVEASAPAPPAETGQRLAVFPRGEGVEMRVSLAEYEGHPYIALRVWERNAAGEWWPVKGKGCSLRLSEAGPLAEALGRLDVPTPRPEPPRPPGTRPAPKRHRPEPRLPLQPDDPRRRWQPPPATSPVSAESSAPFDEFEDHTS